MNSSTKRIIRWSILAFFVALIARKIYIGKVAMNYVSKCKHQIDFKAMISDKNFADTVSKFSDSESRLVIILNQHALNMTFNWLCNTQKMKGVHERTVIVTMDETAKIKLDQTWPQITKIHWPVECLKDPFNYGDGKYQLFFVLRSNLARAFLEFGKPFWMIQQDTFWRENLLELNIESTQPSADIIFDRAAESGGNLIAGGYYFARPTCAAKAFFKQLSYDLEDFYTPDNTYMTILCSNEGLATCGHAPFSMITNYLWLTEPDRLANINRVPSLIQFDGDTKLGGKLQKMKALGFDFVKDDGKTCKLENVKAAQDAVLSSQKNTDRKASRSSSQIQFAVYQWFIDQFYKSAPTKYLLEKFIFPYAHYFMITI